MYHCWTRWSASEPSPRNQSNLEPRLLSWGSGSFSSVIIKIYMYTCWDRGQCIGMIMGGLGMRDEDTLVEKWVWGCGLKGDMTGPATLVEDIMIWGSIPTYQPTHPATLVNFLLLDCHLLSSLSHQDLPSFRFFLEKKKLDNNSEENKEKQIFFRQLCSNSLPCSVSQASKGRWKPIGTHIHRSLHFCQHYNFPFLPDDEQHGNAPLLSVLTASDPHRGPIQLTTFILHLILPTTIHPRDQQ